MVCGTQQDNSHSIREDRVKFFIHKGGVKGLDCIASDQSRPGFYKFSFHHVLHFVFWDLMFNDTFVMCSSIFAQSLHGNCYWWVHLRPIRFHGRS